MLSKSVRFWPMIILATITLSLLVYSGAILADEAETEKTGAVNTTLQQTEVNTDSLYAIIQHDFLQLEPIWKKACYDCHSDKTDYPWYYKLPLIKGMIDEDIADARAEIDMSDGFPFISNRPPVDDLRKLGGEVAQGAMPPGKYKFMHWSASLTEEEKASVAAFVDNSLKMLASHGITPTQRKPRPEGS